MQTLIIECTQWVKQVCLPFQLSFAFVRLQNLFPGKWVALTDETGWLEDAWILNLPHGPCWSDFFILRLCTAHRLWTWNWASTETNALNLEFKDNLYYKVLLPPQKPWSFYVWGFQEGRRPESDLLIILFRLNCCFAHV